VGSRIAVILTPTGRPRVARINVTVLRLARCHRRPSCIRRQEALRNRGRSASHSHENGGGPVRSIERGFGRFERSIRAPRGLDPDAIEASLSDGVLTLRIPKPETMRPRRIEIKGSANGAREHAGATA
jgi:hypothetical protein